MLKFLKNFFRNNNAALQEALQRGAIIVDVRSAAEYRSGAVAGSKNIPLNEIGSKISVIKKWGKPIVTVCRSGNRSIMAQRTLKAAGIESYNGGAWTGMNKVK